MGNEFWNATTESMQRSLMAMIELIVMLTVLCAIAGLVIYLIGIIWFCFKEKRHSRTASPTPRHASVLSTKKLLPLVTDAQQ